MADMSRPLKGTAFTLSFSLYTATGVILNPGTYTARVAKDGAASAAATNSVTEEDTSYGLLSLVLTATEMNADRVDVYVKDDTSGCIAFRATLYPAAAQVATVTETAALATQASVDTIDNFLDTEVAAILADTNELQTDWANGGRLDLLLDAVKAETDTIGAASVTVVSPVADSGAVTIYAGDDYNATHGRELSFLVADATHALGLDNVACVVSFKCSQAIWNATSATSTTAGYTVVFEPTAAETAALTNRMMDYELEAVLADSDVVTLARGTLYVLRDVRG